MLCSETELTYFTEADSHVEHDCHFIWMKSASNIVVGTTYLRAFGLLICSVRFAHLRWEWLFVQTRLNFLIVWAWSKGNWYDVFSTMQGPTQLHILNYVFASAGQQIWVWFRSVCPGLFVSPSHSSSLLQATAAVVFSGKLIYRPLVGNHWCACDGVDGICACLFRSSLLSGILPFGAVFVELFFILSVSLHCSWPCTHARANTQTHTHTHAHTHTHTHTHAHTHLESWTYKAVHHEMATLSWGT